MSHDAPVDRLPGEGLHEYVHRVSGGVFKVVSVVAAAEEAAALSRLEAQIAMLDSRLISNRRSLDPGPPPHSERDYFCIGGSRHLDVVPARDRGRETIVWNSTEAPRFYVNPGQAPDRDTYTVVQETYVRQFTADGRVVWVYDRLTAVELERHLRLLNIQI